MLGAAAPVQTWGDSRLAVSFHRLVMPDGHTYSLDQFKGLDQIGETGLQGRGQSPLPPGLRRVAGHRRDVRPGAIQHDRRVRHVHASATRTGKRPARAWRSRPSRVLDRYLNVLPTITIREGYRIKVYLTNDLDLPAYAPASQEVLQ